MGHVTNQPLLCFAFFLVSVGIFTCQKLQVKIMFGLRPCDLAWMLVEESQRQRVQNPQMLNGWSIYLRFKGSFRGKCR